jgi:hypothetical protein
MESPLLPQKLNFTNMQINLRTPIFKELFKYLGWILLFIFLWLKGCSDNEKSLVTAKVVIPKIEGKFKAQKPTHHIVDPNKKVLIKANSPQLTKGNTVFTENTINPELIAEIEKLKQDFEKANDSIKKLMFANSNQISKFSSNFEDEHLILNFEGIVQGEVKEITPNYTIKERRIKVPVPIKKNNYRVLGGLEVGNNATLGDFKLKGGLLLQNPKGNIISGAVDTNQTFWIGYYKYLF